MAYKVVKPTTEMRDQLRKDCKYKGERLHLKDVTQLRIDPRKFATIRGADQIFRYGEENNEV